MLDSQRLTRELAEAKTKFNELAMSENPDDLELRAAMDSVKSLETRQAALVEKERLDAETAAANGDTPRSSEGREFDRMLDRTSVADYLDAAAAGRAVDGAAAELRAAALGDSAPAEYMPLDMLLPRGRELRADAATSVANAVQDNQSSIAGRIFAVGAGDYLGVDRPTVPFGTQSYVSLTSGGSADFRNDGVAKDADAATFTTKSINPSRVQARYLIDNIVDVRLRGASDALAVDLRMQLSDKLDAVGLKGQAAVSNTSPALTGIINALNDPTNPTAVAVWTDYLDAYDDAVDGKVAMDDSAVRLLVNQATWKQARGLQIATSGELLRDRLPAGRFRVSANMPPTASDIATALAYAAGPGRGFVQAVWRGIRLIRDPFTNSADDRTAVTATLYVGQDMVDASRYRRLEFQLA